VLPVVLLLLSNVFVLWSRLFGVRPTIRLIQAWARRLKLADASLDGVSDCIERSYRRYRVLFVARRQKCIVRGFLLYFYGKRARLDVRLIFGAAASEPGRAPKWHCWIVLDDVVRFEVPEVIGQYTPFIEFA
jgi:hypothetical protein